MVGYYLRIVSPSNPQIYLDALRNTLIGVNEIQIFLPLFRLNI